MTDIVLKNITKKFGKTTAVKDLNLTVKSGFFLTLLGPSGCGKSTTLRMIAGLEDPDNGEIYMDGELVNDLSPRERNVAMVFQSYALYPHMNVFDNIAFPLKMGKLPKDEMREKVHKASELMKITHLLERKPKELSGGERQRVALGRAIVRNPRVFLLDEPLSNLDAMLRIHMRAELKRLQKDLDVTTIYVTHDQVEALTMADKIAIMNKGVLQQLDDPYTVYNNPSNTFVASFIGSPPMNFVDCTLKKKEDQYVLDTGFLEINIPESVSKTIDKNVSNSSAVILGFRSEDIHVFKDKKRELFEAEVYLIEPIGSEVIIDLKIEDKIIKAKSDSYFKADMGDKVWLGLDIRKIIIFDKKSEKIIL